MRFNRASTGAFSVGLFALVFFAGLFVLALRRSRRSLLMGIARAPAPRSHSLPFGCTAYFFKALSEIWFLFYPSGDSGIATGPNQSTFR
jgi:hypothetical protein